MIIRIGKASDNDYIVNDDHVSRHHAYLLRNEQGWFIEDIQSTNGTYVNGCQVVKKKICSSDSIILGDKYVLDIKSALRSVNDYSEDFLALKDVYEKYISEKIKIQSNNQFKTRLFQSLPFALPGVVGIAVGFWGNGTPQLFGLSLSLAICAPTIGIYMGAKQSAKIPQLLQDISNQFKIDYVCPKCGTFLGETPWESLRNKKQCPVPSCKAKWVSF